MVYANPDVVLAAGRRAQSPAVVRAVSASSTKFVGIARPFEDDAVGIAVRQSEFRRPGVLPDDQRGRGVGLQGIGRIRDVLFVDQAAGFPLEGGERGQFLELIELEDGYIALGIFEDEDEIYYPYCSALDQLG